MDDGSTDETQKALKPYFDKIHYLHQKNSGVSAARNAGIKAAQGEWIAFLDSDDTWDANKLKIQMEDLKQNPSAIAHMVDSIIILNSSIQNPSLFELRGLSIEFKQNPFRVRPLMDVLESQFFTPTWMIRHDILEKVGYFNTELNIYEDIDLLTRVALEGAFVVNCYPGVKVRRQHGGAQPLSNLHKTARIQSFHNLIHIYSNLKTDMRLSLEERKHVSRLLGGTWCETAGEHKKQKQWGAFNHAILRSVAAEPGLRSVARALLTATGLKILIQQVLPIGRKNGGFRRSEIDSSHKK